MSVQSVMHVADAGQAILPAEVPMSMPEQSFRTAGCRCRGNALRRG